jgi:hypothetical protein
MDRNRRAGPLVILFLLLMAGLPGCNPAFGIPASTAELPSIGSPLTLVMPVEWYVEKTGSDANDCLSVQTPCLTIAAVIAKAGDGDTINIGAGSFPEYLLINKSLHFMGKGMDATIVERAGSGMLMGLFDIRGTSQQPLAVSVEDMTIQKSMVDSSYRNPSNGGAINAVDADLTVRNVRIAGNRVTGLGSGGGVYCHSSGAVPRTVIIQDSIIESNVTNFQGGGIWCDSTLSIENVTFNYNRSVAGYNNSTGSSLYALGNTTISGSRFYSDNYGGNFREVIYFSNEKLKSSQLLIEDSLFNGAISGGIWNEYGTATIRRSLFVNVGGVAIMTKGNLLVENTTFSDENGVAISAYFKDALVVLNNVSIVGFYYGLEVMYGSQMTMQNTLIVGSSHGACNFVTSNQYAPPYITGLNNLATDAYCGAAAQVISDALLGPLADNGGGTQTFALLPGSPAIDSGQAIPGMTTDQRGMLRPLDGNGDGVDTFDIGAYELDAGIPTSTPTVATPTFTFTPSGTPTNTFTPSFTPSQTPTATFTFTPSPTHTFTPISSLTFYSRVSTQTFYYRRDCYPDPAEVTIHAILSDTAGVQEVDLFYHLVNDAQGINTPWNKGVTMMPVGTSDYQAVVSFLDIPEWSSLGGNSAELRYQFIAVDSAYQVMARSPVYNDVTLSSCR